jgi:hypothetical protein
MEFISMFATMFIPNFNKNHSLEVRIPALYTGDPRIQNFAQRPAILTGVLNDFPQFSQANAKIAS